MKLKMLLAALAIPALLLIAACGGGGEAGGPVNDFLKLLPRDTEEMVYINTATLLDDDDLSNLRGYVESQWLYSKFSSFGVRFRDLSYLAFAEVDSDYIYLLGGLEDLEGLRDELYDHDYDEDEIRGVEVWVHTSKSREAFAFLPNGQVLVAENEELMENLLRRRERGSSSMYDEVEGIVSTLSSDTLLAVSPNCYSTNCDFVGYSIEQVSSRDFKMAVVAEFESNYDAEYAFEDVEDEDAFKDRKDEDFDSSCDDPLVKRSGSRITIDVTCDIDTAYIVYIMSLDFNF